MAAGAPASSAPDRVATSAPRAVPLVGGARLPLAFIGFGLAAFAAGPAWSALDREIFLLPYLHPRVVAFVHLWLPGFLLSVSIGALYQLMPVVLGAPLRAGVTKLWIHFVLHAVGATALVLGFAASRFDYVAAGGSLVAIGTLFLFVTVLRTFSTATRRDAAAWSFPLATGWLAVTVLFGIALALNRRWPWLPLSAVDLLRAHAHLGLVGFFLTLLQGTMFQLIPMFTMGDARRPRLIWTGLLATQAGLPVLTAGLAWHHRLSAIAGAAIIVAGIVCTGIALLATLRTRRRRVLEPGIQAFVAGFGLITLAALGGLALVVAPGDSPAFLQMISGYGIVAIPGALSLCVLGMLCKIVPFLVWMRAYGPKVGKQPVPVATSLASKALERGWLIAHLAAIALLVVACGLPSATLALIGGATLAVSAALFLTTAVRVAAHLWRA